MNLLFNKKVIMLAEGNLGVMTSKVCASFIRYKPEDCVAVIDSSKSQRFVNEVLGYGNEIPIVDSIQECLKFEPDVLLIGMGTYSNTLPESWRQTIKFALLNGIHVVSGLHFRIGNDAELSRIAADNNCEIWDSKEPPKDLRTSVNNVEELESSSTYVIHTVGSDCRVGKKTTSLEIAKSANTRGYKAGVAATGQSGMYITGSGVAVDAVPADFIAGATEQLVQETAKNNDWVVVEGQGSISHPAYSGVTLGLLHGAMPEALVLCHQADLNHHKNWPHIPLRSIQELVQLYEQLAACIRPAKVVAISLNCSHLSKEQADQYAEQLEKQVGLPVADVIHHGADKIVDALAAFQSSKQVERVA